MWAVGGQALAEPIRVLGTAVLARVLTPEDFGLLGMAAVFFGLTAITTELGPSAAIIGRKRLSDDEVSSLFWLCTIAGVVLAVICVLAAPLIARIYREPRVAPVFAALSLTVLLSAEALVHNALLRRRMDFRTPALANLASVAINAAVAVGCALSGLQYWSLVAGTLAGVVTSVLLVQAGARFRPRLHLRWAEVRPYLSFSGQVTGAEFANYGSTNVDNLLVGRLLGSSALGIYALAYNLVTYPVRMFASLVAQAALPAFCRLADDAARLRSAYVAALRKSSAVVLPALLAAVVAAPDLVVGLYGPKWEAAVLPFQLLCLAGAARSVGVFGRAAFKAVGRPGLQVRWDIALLIGVAVGAAVGSRWGVAGVAAAVAVATTCATLGLQVDVSRSLSLAPSGSARALAPAAGLAAGAALACLAVEWVLAPTGLPLIVRGLLAVVSALAVTWAWGRFVFADVRDLERLAVSALSRDRSSAANTTPDPDPAV